VRRRSAAPLAVLALALAGCSGNASLVDTRSGRIALDCAPFARALSGIELRGDADAWWDEAEGRYRRDSIPAVGSVLVFRRSDRLPSGHVGVVSRVVSSREIELTQANWVHRQVSMDQPAIDISPGNDWTLVRVFWPPAGQMGATAYPTYGFIDADFPATHETLAARVPGASLLAVNP
jgi:hypothetical protein